MSDKKNTNLKKNNNTKANKTNSKNSKPNTTSSNKKKKSSNYSPGSTYDRFRVNRPVDIVNIIYLIFITSIFSLYMHNKYFDITGTRAKTFANVSIIYVVLLVMAVVIEVFMIWYYEPQLSFKDLFYKDSKWIAMPELWAILFAVANIVAWFMSPDKKGSWDGSTGRFMGLSFILVLVLVVVSLSREACPSKFILISLFATSIIVYTIAVLQHFGNDPFALRDRVVDRQKEMFISTFGNINTYGSYLAIILPLFVALFVFSEKLWIRIITGISITMAAMAIIPAKSDNVYLGTGAAFLVLFYIAIYYKRFTEYIFSVLLMGAGLLFMAYANSVLKGSQKHINGVAEIVENPKVMCLFVFLIVVILILSMTFRTMNYEMYKRIQGWKLLVVITGLLLIAGVAVVVLGIKTKNSFFVFNDKWGTYRGYIWRRSMDIFKNGTVGQKLFGHGNETIALNMRTYYDEMVSITGKKYDNSHCEFIQYLVTTGIFGVITYYGFAASGFIYILKRMEGDAVAIAALAGCIGYLVQGLVNLNQPITTPFYFVLMAFGIGYIRYRDQGYGVFRD